LALYGSSEAVQSAAWFPSGSPKIAAGMAMKYIRIYDVKSNLYLLIYIIIIIFIR